LCLFKTVILWDVKTGEELKKFEGHLRSVRSCNFSPDGKTIVSGSFTTGSFVKTLILWDVVTGNELQKLGGHTASVMSCNFSPDGKKIVSGSRDTTLILSS
jgi:WD40 repeat protein